MTAKEHNKLLSIFFFIQGGLQIVAGLFVAVIYGGIGAAVVSTSNRGEDQMMGGIFIVLAIAIAIFILAFASVYLFTAFKILKERPVGRTLGIVASCLALLSFPLGTALGVYGLWFFFGEVGKNFYAGLNGAYSPPPRPPAPNSWQ